MVVEKKYKSRHHTDKRWSAKVRHLLREALLKSTSKFDYIRNKPVMIKTRLYPSMAEAARRLHLSKDIISYRVRTFKKGYYLLDKENETVKKLFESKKRTSEVKLMIYELIIQLDKELEKPRQEYILDKQRKNKNIKPVLINGKSYPSISNASKHLHISSKSIQYYLKK